MTLAALAKIKRIKQLKLERDARRAAGKYNPGTIIRLRDLFVQVTPEFDPPDHLAPYAVLLERAIPSEKMHPLVKRGGDWRHTAERGNLREVVAAPPQHGKTELTLRAYLFWARYFPGLNHAYITYNQRRKDDVAKNLQRVARGATYDSGAPMFRVNGNLDVIEITPLDESGNPGTLTQVKFTSVKGDLTGYAITGVGVVDDPVKNAIEAQSRAVINMGIDFYKSVLRSRRHEGTSLIVMATRWSVSDLSGFLLKEESFRYTNLKAIAELEPGEKKGPYGLILSDPLQRKEGEPLWHRKPAEFFVEEQKDRYWWSAMYQGTPMPKGGAVFEREAVYYSELPSLGFNVGVGLDMAYSKKTKSDFTVMIKGHAVGGMLYVTDMFRKQETILTAPKRLKEFVPQGAPVRWYTGGQEKALVQTLKRDTGCRIKAIPAKGDKFIRATGVARAWNNGKVLLPAGAKWLPEFIAEISTFTGDDSGHDDIVDALAALYDELCGKGSMIKALMG